MNLIERATITFQSVLIMIYKYLQQQKPHILKSFHGNAGLATPIPKPNLRDLCVTNCPSKYALKALTGITGACLRVIDRLNSAALAVSSPVT